VEVDTGGNIGAVPVNEVWAIGARSRALADRFFDGEIDDVRIYDRVLSAEDIVLLVTAPSLRR
jgi:Concanavalin A-like lectin/glucanases superfamily